jgi:outer membrane scaffolding protein for murein synthesis (MipA/OmpV family)
VLFCAAAAPAHSQTPSPLQEWQYSSGIILERLFEPQVPEWRVVAGVGDEIKPLYDGARIYKAQAGPVFNIRYYDYAFASVGEGFGVNILRGDHYRVGIALGYDLGRYVSDDPVHLHGMGDIRRSPVIKVFESVAVSKKFPLVLRADVRQYVGGADGAAADLEAYMPLPGSSKKFVMFAGPSITFADHLFLQKEFGVSASQSLASGYPGFDTHAGTNSVGFGFSATRFISKRWLINLDAAVNHLRGSADTSPISQRGGQRVLALSVAWNE